MTNTLEQRARELLAEVLSIPVCMVDDVQSVKAAYLLKAIEAALRLPAGEGWVMVPREPTPEMLRAGFLSDAEGFGIDTPADAPWLVYRAMIAAAPTITAAEGE